MSPKQALYPGEVLDRVNNRPCLWQYLPASPDQPLHVFVPGGAHTARIAYGGHDGSQPPDFLAYWLNERGYGFLGVSYPLESIPELMPAVSPGFTITQWGEQAASLTAAVVRQYRLRREIVVLAWSMAGRVAVPLAHAARSRGLHVALFVSLAATPALPRMLPRPRHWQCTARGYATYAGAVDKFYRQIEVQATLNGESTVMDQEIYQDQYFGRLPVRLAGWNLTPDGQGGFEEEDARDAEDHAATAFQDLPWMAALYPSSPLDARHALTDRATWGFLMTRRIAAQAEASLSNVGPGDKWRKLVALVHDLPDAMSAQVAGTHFFFLGQAGARETAGQIARLLSQREEWHQALQKLLHPS